MHAKSYLWIPLALSVLLSAVSAQAQFVSARLPVAATIAANTTNAVAATEKDLSALVPHKPTYFRLTMRATGGTVAATNSFTMWFSASPDGVNFDTAENSLIKLTTTMTGTNAVQYADYFSLVGVSSIRVGRIVNSCSAAVNNIQVWISYP